MNRSIRHIVSEKTETFTVPEDYRTRIRTELVGLKPAIYNGASIRFTRMYNEGRSAIYDIGEISKTQIRVCVHTTGVTPERALRDLKRAMDGKKANLSPDVKANAAEPQDTHQFYLVAPGNYADALPNVVGLVDLRHDADCVEYLQCFGNPMDAAYFRKRPVNVKLTPISVARDDSNRVLLGFSARSESSNDVELARDVFMQLTGSKTIDANLFEKFARGISGGTEA